MTGKQKAAMLLLSLDSMTASELLKGLDPDDVQDIGMELAKIDAQGKRNSAEAVMIAKEFYHTLATGQAPTFTIKNFLEEMLVNIVGSAKASTIQKQIQDATLRRDPFISIRSTSVDELVLALDSEHPQTAAVVLSELPSKTSQEVISHLDESLREGIILKMTQLDLVSAEMRTRIADMIKKKLADVKGETLPEDRKKTLRRLALLLSGLDREVRDILLEKIGEEDEATMTMVRNLMVTWHDIIFVADRTLQDSLKSVDTQKLALALFGAEQAILEKIKSNISERAAETLDEEISLMQEPLEEEVIEAQEVLLEPLRQANEEGKLRMIKKQ